MSHTILLIQPTGSETRTYCDFENINDAMEGVCHIYESHLKKLNPTMSEVSYDAQELFQFIDSLKDLSVLVYQRATNTYGPYDREFIKEKILLLLQRQVTKSMSAASGAGATAAGAEAWD